MITLLTVCESVGSKYYNDNDDSDDCDYQVEDDDDNDDKGDDDDKTACVRVWDNSHMSHHPLFHQAPHAEVDNSQQDDGDDARGNCSESLFQILAHVKLWNSHIFNLQ